MGLNHKREKNIKKLSWWDGERELDTQDRLLWDVDNMPIQSGEFFQFNNHKGMFRTIKRENPDAQKLIKSRKVGHVAYCVSNIPDELQGASTYFQGIMHVAQEELE